MNIRIGPRLPISKFDHGMCLQQTHMPAIGWGTTSRMPAAGLFLICSDTRAGRNGGAGLLLAIEMRRSVLPLHPCLAHMLLFAATVSLVYEIRTLKLIGPKCQDWLKLTGGTREITGPISISLPRRQGKTRFFCNVFFLSDTFLLHAQSVCPLVSLLHQALIRPE